MDLTGKYAVTDGDRAAGGLEISREGMFYRFRAACRSGGEGMMRLYISSGAAQADLGILAPCDGLWRLDRSLSARTLHEMGITGVDGCRIVHESGSWRAEDRPELLFAEPELQAACLGAKGVMALRRADEVLAAVPAESGKPFPAMTVFCLGHAQEICGKSYVVFRLKNGRVVF